MLLTHTDDEVIDFGARFLHGKKGNPLFKLAKRNGVHLVNERKLGRSVATYPDGTIVANKIALQVDDVLDTIWDNPGEMNAAHDSYGDYLREQFRLRIPAGLSKGLHETFIGIFCVHTFFI